ncbi:MAG TPA: ABC transporter substrate-binding protein [Anaerolineaceae bacterium]|nr:ABC transporter substrate-binding protein [Anaerolineaceae bacterium]
MKAAWIRLFSLVLVVVLLAGCTALPVAQTGPEEVDPPAQAEVVEPVTLKAGYLPIGSYLPLYVAIAKGYFEEQGITLELQSFRTGAEMVAPLSLSQLDIGAGEVGTAFFNAVAQDLPVRVVLPMGFLRAENSYLPLVARKDLFDSGAFDSLEDQAGKKIAVNAVRGLTEWVAAKALEAGGLSVDDVELVVIPFPEMVQALQNNAVDGAWIQYPVASTALNPGPNGEEPIAVRLIGGDEATDNAQVTAFYFGERLLKPENRETAVRVCMALIKAFRFINDEDWKADEDVIATMAEITQTSPEAIRAGVYAGFDPNGRMKVESLAAMQAYYVERAYTEYDKVIAMDGVIDDSFWQEALERLGEVQP